MLKHGMKPIDVLRALENNPKEEDKCPQIVAATPAQCKKIVKAPSMSGGRGTIGDDVVLVIFDEADDLLKEDSRSSGGKGGGRGGKGGGKGGFQNQNQAQECAEIVEYCPNAQIGLFSATFEGNLMEVAHDLAEGSGRGKRHVESIKVEDPHGGSSVDSIVQCYLQLGRGGGTLKEKADLVAKLFNSHDFTQMVMFVAKIDDVEELKRQLTHPDVNIACETFHSRMGEMDQVHAMRRFETQLVRVLIATDNIQRGWDPPGVGLVVQFDMPHRGNGDDEALASYQHRIGRTGRAGKAGVSLCFVKDDETSFLQKIESDQAQKGYKKEIKKFDPSDYIERIGIELEAVHAQKPAAGAK